jgi:hypothetical protein
LRKSEVKSEVEVVNASDKVEAKSEASATATIALSEDTPDFEFGMT